MGKSDIILRGTFIVIFCALFCTGPRTVSAQNAGDQVTNSTIVGIVGTVQVARGGGPRLDPPAVNWPLLVGDRVVVGPRSQLTVRRMDESIYRFPEMSDFVIRPAGGTNTQRSSFRLLSGVLYFFHRGKPGEVEVETPSASAAVRGTEFVISVDAAGTTIVTVMDGVVDLSNQIGGVTVRNGEQGVAQVGVAPVVRPALNMADTIQWMLYYPGVLDAQELVMTDGERSALTESLAAYASGDLVGALARRSENTAGVASGIYHAALLLSVGQVEDAQRLLNAATQNLGAQGGVNLRLAEALRELIAVVKSGIAQRGNAPKLATEWMVESYRLQSGRQLDEALTAARNAAAKSTNFSFAWARVAELEFSFGRIDAAKDAVERALELGPRNAQAVSLKGFLLAAQNKTKAAAAQFERAIELDPSLANAWLGRGLVRIRSGASTEGRADLLTAAALEPQRGFLRSYLAKAWTDAGKEDLAAHEIELAKGLDPQDPTAWLYSALLKYQQNRINEAVRELEHAQTINTNRAVYRSRFLLDQDQAVRSANLANIYRDVGMFDWSVREAGRAVTADYANYSAHLFLATSYDQLRDPNRVNLRYETPAEAEYFIANLLAPVGAGLLSPTISQQEYSKLFERDRLGFASLTEYWSRGAWVQESSVFGTFGNSSFNVEQYYRTDPGQRINNDYESTELRLHFKQQLTAKDSVYFRAIGYETEGGDVFQRYDPASGNPASRFEEEQEPLVTLGYHREWSPGMHTIVVASGADTEFKVNDPTALGLLMDRDFEGNIFGVEPMTTHLRYRYGFKVYSGEAQQIFQTPKHTTILGVRFQEGEFHTRNLQTDPSINVGQWFNGPAADQEFTTDFQRFSAYGYHHWNVLDSLLLVGGLSYDRMEFPENFRAPPVTGEQQDVDRVSPKAGFIWTPMGGTSLRGAYTRSLQGAALDQSLTIEPTQVAGLNQSFRSIKPESVLGTEAGAKFETMALSVEQRFKSNTYLTIAGELLDSERNSVLGVFDKDFFGVALPNTTPRTLDYEEQSLTASLDQLIGRDLAIGARYRLTRAEYEELFPEVRPFDPSFLVGGFKAETELRATLHQVEVHAIYNHPLGFFAKAQTIWNNQSNSGYEPSLEGDEFWHFNLYAGYRFLQRRGEITVGLLNIADQDYRLNPLTLYNEFPRERTFYCRLRLRF